MDFEAIANSIARQFVTVWQNPVPFITVGLLLWWIIWKAVQREFATRVANSQSTIEMLKERLDRVETGEAMAIAGASQQTEESHPEPVRPAPAARPVEAGAATEPKVYVPDGFDPDYITKMLESKTSLQSRALFNSEMGKWMRVEGNVRAVTATRSEKVTVAIRASPEADLVFARFPRITPELENMSIGDVATIEGRLEEVSGIGISLEDCSLISTHPASA